MSAVLPEAVVLSVRGDKWDSYARDVREVDGLDYDYFAIIRLYDEWKPDKVPGMNYARVAWTASASREAVLEEFTRAAEDLKKYVAEKPAQQ